MGWNDGLSLRHTFSAMTVKTASKVFLFYIQLRKQSDVTSSAKKNPFIFLM